MENKKKIIYLCLITSIILGSCKMPEQKKNLQKEKISCANDPRLFQSINSQNLLFKDSLDIIYLRVKNEQLKGTTELSDCQKLPYVFIKEMALKNDSIVELNNIIDIATFTKYANNLYIDNRRTYYHETETTAYPSFLK